MDRVAVVAGSLSVAPPRQRPSPVDPRWLLPAIGLVLPVGDGVLAQGCVGAPNNPCTLMIPGGLDETQVGARQWSGFFSYRWFQSDRHFVGDVEQPQRQQLDTQVVNTVNLFSLGATYGVTEHLNVTLSIPFSYSTRSSLYEHDRTNRYTVKAGGMGDLRLVADYWLLDPHRHMDGNLAVGIGFEAPTGVYDATDTAYRATGPVERPVDQSIQPGDGGWGLVLQLQGYQKLQENLYGYIEGGYLMSPQGDNGVQTPLGDLRPVGPTTYNSIPDQYFGRGGFSYYVLPEQGLSISFGARIEGVTVYDVIGDSMGFRRPGYTVSLEPGIGWSTPRNSLTILVPFAVYRNRLQSAPEIALGRPGGDAAFADFSVQATFSHRF